MGSQNSTQSNNAAGENYACRSKATIKPFSFRWEIERFSLRLTPYGEFLDSPKFEVGMDRVPMFLQLCRNKAENGEEFLSVYLSKHPTYPYKKVKLVYSVTLVNSKPKNNYIVKKESPTVFDENPLTYRKTTWKCSRWLQFIAYSTVVDKSAGFLKDGHLLTLIVEGNAIVDEKPKNFDNEFNVFPLDMVLRDDALDDFGKLFNDGLHTDFIVKAKDANGVWKELKVHKGVLAARSEVFAAMLSNPEVKESRDGVLEVKDIDSGAMETLLRFLYTGKIPPQLETSQDEEGNNKGKGLLSLLIAADKYGILRLKNHLESVLAAKLSVENVCEIFVIAGRHSAPFLAARGKEFAREKVAEVAKTDGWRELFVPENLDLVEELFTP